MCCILKFTRCPVRVTSCLGRSDPHRLMQNRSEVAYLESSRQEWRSRVARRCVCGNAKAWMEAICSAAASRLFQGADREEIEGKVACGAGVIGHYTFILTSTFCFWLFFCDIFNFVLCAAACFDGETCAREVNAATKIKVLGFFLKMNKRP